MMQRKFFEPIILAVLFLCSASILSAQTNVKKWSFQTNGKVEASVQVSNDTLFIGSKDSTFYALDTLGALIWKVKVPYQIKSTASFSGNHVYFEAGNRLYALKKSNGEEVWTHEPAEVVGKDVIQNIDNWDLKGPSPILDNNTLYYGNQFGSVYGVNASSGAEEFHFHTDTSFAIRTKPAIMNDTLYFADWDGYVYAVSLKTETLLWSYHTYTGTKPYAAFGPIIGEMLIVDDLLMCGIRNHNYQVFNRKTGEVAWTFSRGNTWLSGIPVVLNDTLYLGTSDTHILFALNPENGDEYWRKGVELGLYNKAAFYKNYIVVTGGEEQMRSNTGEGIIALLNKTGELVNAVSLDASCFNSPTIRKNDLYFGTYKGEVLCYNLEALTQNKIDSINTNIGAYNGETLPDKSIVTEELGYIKNLGNDTLLLQVEPDDSEFPDGAVRVLLDELLNVSDSTLLKLRINQGLLENDHYQTTILIRLPENPSLNFEIPVSFTVENGSSPIDKISKTYQVEVFPNPASDIATIELTLEQRGFGQILFFDISGKQLDTIPFETKAGESQQIQWKVNTNTMAFYTVMLNNEPVSSGKILIQ